MSETTWMQPLYREQRRQNHDDVIKWKLFPHNWPFVWGIHWSPVNSPHKGQWRGALMSPLICVWINCWVNNGEAGDLRRYCAHYDVIVMWLQWYCGIIWTLGKVSTRTNIFLPYVSIEILILSLVIIVPHLSKGQNCLHLFVLQKICPWHPQQMYHIRINHQISFIKCMESKKLKCFSSPLAVVFVQSIEARY